MFFNSNKVNGTYYNSSGMLTTSGDLIYGTSQGFDDGDFSLFNTGSGVGLDLGFTYEYKTTKIKGSVDPLNGYKLKIGLAGYDTRAGLSFYNSVRNVLWEK